MALDCVEHAQKRVQKLDSTYHDRWPRWTYADYVTLRFLLSHYYTTRPAEPEKPATVE